MLIFYILVLLVSAVLLSIAAARGYGQRTGARILNGVFAAAFLGYAIYLGLFFDGGTVYFSLWAVVLPAIALFRAFRARQAARTAARSAYPDIYAQPAQQWAPAPAQHWASTPGNVQPWTPAQPAGPPGPSPTSTWHPAPFNPSAAWTPADPAAPAPAAAADPAPAADSDRPPARHRR